LSLWLRRYARGHRLDTACRERLMLMGGGGLLGALLIIALVLLSCAESRLSDT
jgi:type II secretory pathway component PulM